VKGELGRLQRERKAMIEEVQRVNKFAVEAVRRQPEREETLLWVNKLLEFMAHTSEMGAQEQRDREQALLAITLHISQELRQLNAEYSQQDALIASDRLQFLEAVQRLASQLEQDCQEASRTNQQFWEGLLKVRDREERDYTAQLEHELMSVQAALEQERRELREQLAGCEKEKRSLLGGLQELRVYYELR
jgi:hypothetical protein